MDNKVIYPWEKLMNSSKCEILDLYKEHKEKGQTVYFQNKEGLWLLDHKGDATLIQE